MAYYLHRNHLMEMEMNPDSVGAEQLLRRSEASGYLNEIWRIPHSTATLAKLAVVGGGPEFRKAGRTPLYPQDGLDTYAQSRMSRRVRSTAELDANKSGHPRDHRNDVEGFDPPIHINDRSSALSTRQLSRVTPARPPRAGSVARRGAVAPPAAPHGRERSDKRARQPLERRPPRKARTPPPILLRT
jgi:hypothetical protein